MFFCDVYIGFENHELRKKKLLSTFQKFVSDNKLKKINVHEFGSGQKPLIDELHELFRPQEDIIKINYSCSDYFECLEYPQGI